MHCVTVVIRHRIYANYIGFAFFPPEPAPVRASHAGRPLPLPAGPRPRARQGRERERKRETEREREREAVREVLWQLYISWIGIVKSFIQNKYPYTVYAKKETYTLTLN